MTDILIQFHALPEELRPLISWSMAELGVHITAFRFQPFQAVDVRPNMLDALLLDPSVDEVAFTLEAPTRSVTAMNEFLDLHPGALRLDIGRQTEKGLSESCLSCRTSDTRSLEVWRKLARKLRSATKAGAIAINPVTGATSKSRNHRYTEGAKALDQRGVPIIPVAGGTVLHFEESAHK